MTSAPRTAVTEQQQQHDKISQTIQHLRKRLKGEENGQTESTGNDEVMNTYLLDLKSQSRLLQENTSVSKENIAQLKKQVDVTTLSLQSLLYEKQHLEEELFACLATPVFDSVELSQSLTVTFPTRKQEMDNKVDRIQSELKLRQALTQEVTDLQNELKKETAEVSSLKAILEGIPSKIMDVEKTTQQLEKFVGVQSISEKRERREMIAKGPQALMKLFLALESHADADKTASFILRVRDDPAYVVTIEFLSPLNEVIEFSFLQEWNVVLVESQVNQDLLVGLLDEADTGEVLPPATLLQQLAAVDPPSFKNAIKRPFKWAQGLSGLDESTNATALTVCTALLDRLQARGR